MALGVEVFTLCDALDPDNGVRWLVAARLDVAMTLAQLGLLPDVCSAWLHGIVAEGPWRLQSLPVLAAMWEKRGNACQAIQCLEEAVRLAPDSLDLHEKVCRLLLVADMPPPGGRLGQTCAGRRQGAGMGLAPVGLGVMGAP